MAFTFSPTLAMPVDRIRQNLGDTVNGTGDAACDVQDETINAYLSMGLTEVGATAKLARDLAAKYAKKITTSVDRQSIEYSKIFDNYVSIALTFEAMAKGQDIVPPTGGVTISGVSVGSVMVTGGDCPGWSPRDIYCRY